MLSIKLINKGKRINKEKEYKFSLVDFCVARARKVEKYNNFGNIGGWESRLEGKDIKVTKKYIK